MRKEFTLNIIFLLAINLIIKPFYALVVDTTVQNRVGPETYGVYLALFNFVYIQQIFADLGLQQYNNASVAKDPGKINAIMPRILGTKIILSLFFIVLVLISSLVFGYATYLSSTLGWIIANMVLLSSVLYLRTNISGIGRYFTDSLFSVLDKLVLILLLGYLLWYAENGQPFTIIDFVKAQFLSLVITLAALLGYTHITILKLRFELDPSFIREMIMKSLPYASLILLMAGYSRVDSIMIERLIQDGGLEAGKYAAAFRLYDTWNGFTFLFAVLLLPMYSSVIDKKDEIRRLEKWSARLVALGGLFIMAISIVFSQEILGVFYTATIDQTYIFSFRMLMVAGIPLSLIYIYGSLLTANGNLKLLNKIALGGFLLNIAMNAAAIPFFGAKGAAFTTLLTQGFVFLLQYINARQLFNLELKWTKMIAMIFLGTITFLSMILSYHMLSFSWITSILVSGLLFVLMAFLLKLISRDVFFEWKTGH